MLTPTTTDFVSKQPDSATIEAPAGYTDEQPAFGSDLVVSALRTLGYRCWRGLHDSVVNFGANRDLQLLLFLQEEIAVCSRTSMPRTVACSRQLQCTTWSV